MAIYLYGFTSDRGPAPPPTLAGVDDASVDLLDCGGVRAVVSRLPEGWDAAETVDARLEDMGWVGQQGLAHEGVVAWFVDHADIVPAPFLTLFSSEDRLVEQARARRDAVRQQLERFAGLREWDLKVGYDARQLGEHLGEIEPEVAALDAEIAAAAPGRRFLLDKKRTERVRALTARTARELAGELLDRLRAEARDARILPLPRSDDSVPVVLNAALLFARDEEDGARALAAERSRDLERVGVTVRFSGPWAPYRFMQEEEEEVAQ